MEYPKQLLNDSSRRHLVAWKKAFDKVMLDMTDDKIEESINMTYHDDFIERSFLYEGYLHAWIGEWQRGTIYISNRLTRSMTNDNWWTEAIKYRIMRLESDILGSKVDDPYEWAKHVFPPQYEGCEEDEEEEEDEDEPIDWQPPVDRVLPYPRHHLKRKHYDDIDE